jgi:hypothetical protein
MCNIPIYFCNIYMNHLQYTSETSKTFKTYACNMCFQRSAPLLAIVFKETFYDKNMICNATIMNVTYNNVEYIQTGCKFSQYFSTYVVLLRMHAGAAFICTRFPCLMKTLVTRSTCYNICLK